MRFGRFEVRPAQRQVLVDGQPAAMAARAYDVLWTLIQHCDRVITKNELLDLVWPGVVVEEHNLHTQVSLLRKVIGANAIATIPGRGYRFVAVAQADGREPPANPAAAQVPLEDRPPANEGRARSSAPGAGRVALIGRDADLAALDELLRDCRVLTICGPGGVGKTTVARALVDRLAATEGAGTAWVELSSVNDATRIAEAIALALNIGEQTELTPATLCRTLARRQALVVLDNCEHLIEAIAQLVQMLLDAAPAIRFLATSREPLKLRDEQRYILEGLSRAEAGASLADVRDTAAAQLLEARARLDDSRFRLGAEHVASAIELCQALEGNPLAIEMAASRIHLFGVAGVRGRIGERLQFLSSGARNPEQRHSSLWATLHWSYALLSESAQQALRRLSVFVGAFDITVAEQLLQQAGDSSPQATEAIAELAAKSLVAEVRGEFPRQRLAETTRLFAAELLARHGEHDATLGHHGQVMVRHAEQAEEQHWRLSDKAWLARYSSDLPDLLAAFARAFERNDADTAAALGIGLRPHLLFKAMDAPTRQLTQQLLGLLPHAGPLAEARIWTFVSSLNPVAVNGIPRIDATKRRLALWRERGDEWFVFEALCRYVLDLMEHEELALAEAELQTLTRLTKAEWPPRRRYLAARVQAYFAQWAGRPDFEIKLRAALRLATEAGDIGQIARCHVLLAEDALLAGRNDEALALCRAATEATTRGGAIFLLPNTLVETCVYAIHGDYVSAKQAGLRALERAVGMGVTAVPMDRIALLAARLGRWRESARLLGAWDAWAATRGVTRGPTELLVLRLIEEALDSAAGREQQLEQRALGAGLSEEDLHALALAILGLPEQAESTAATP